VDAFERPFDVDGSLTDIGASIGIALYPDDGHTAEQLLANADMALYRAKNTGRGCACFFRTGNGHGGAPPQTPCARA
jgi:diguanylate cyclase (GGDEF)-like protein